MLAVIFAILTFIGWGTGDIFGVFSSRRLGAFRSALWVNIITVPYLAILAPFFLDELFTFTLPILILNAVLGVIVTCAFMAFLEGARLGKPSILGAIAGSFPALVVILSIIFLGEKLSSIQALAIVVIIAGIVLTSINFKELSGSKVKLERSIGFALLAMVLWGIFFTFIRIPVQQVGWFWANAVSNFAGILALLAYGWRSSGLSRSDIRQGIPPIIGVVLLGGTAMLTYNVAVEVGKNSIVAPIAGAYPVLFVILSSIIFKDKLTKHQIFGMILALTGIVALSLASA